MGLFYTICRLTYSIRYLSIKDCQTSDLQVLVPPSSPPKTTPERRTDGGRVTRECTRKETRLLSFSRDHREGEKYFYCQDNLVSRCEYWIKLGLMEELCQCNLQSGSCMIKTHLCQVRYCPPIDPPLLIFLSSP